MGASAAEPLDPRLDIRLDIPRRASSMGAARDMLVEVDDVWNFRVAKFKITHRQRAGSRVHSNRCPGMDSNRMMQQFYLAVMTNTGTVVGKVVNRERVKIQYSIGQERRPLIISRTSGGVT